MRVFVTGSADGLGLALGRRLAAEGHDVMLHGRDERRAGEAAASVPQAAGALAGDLASVAETRQLAQRANESGRFDAVVHNAGLGFREARRVTADGIEHVFAVNVLAPYVLTALMTPPDRLIYLSSGLHTRGDPRLDDLAWERREWNPMQAYCDSKLLDVALALAVATRWPHGHANAVEPGWIATKMGGHNAPGTLAEGADTQFWLATSHEPEALVSGRLLHHRQVKPPHASAEDPHLQHELLDVAQRISAVSLPSPD